MSRLFSGGRWLLVASILGNSPDPAVGQECPSGTIARIQVETLEVFDLGEFQEGSFPYWVFRTANSIHIDTSENYVRNELLFEEGSCFDPFLLEESARILRTRVFIKWAEVNSERLPDGNVAVTVRVQDDWTLKVGLGLSFDEGINLEELLLQENNLLGRGFLVAIARVQAREIRETSGRFGAARLFGTPWTFDGSGGETRQGPFVEGKLSYPFTSETSRTAFATAFEFREDFFPYSTSGVENPTHALLPFKRQFAQFTYARRFGQPGHLWLLGGGFSREDLEFPEGPEGLQMVMDEDFSDLFPAAEAEIQEVRRQTDPQSATRANLFLGFRNIDYVLREGLDAVRASQDVKVGTEFTLSMSPSLAASTDSEDMRDLHGRADFFWAATPGPWVFSTVVKAEGRYVWNAEVTSEGWRDVITELDLKAYLKPATLGSHTLMSRFSAARSWSMDRPFQLTAGGREGVRGYSQDAFPGGRRLLLSVEDRFPVVNSEVIDAGMVFFGDVGRVWGQDVPFGVNSGWRSSVGVGIRLNLPGGALRTMRADFTLPLSGDRDVHGVYFRLYTELGGLLQVPKRPGQVDRSRWSGINTDLNVARASG
jgi:hypothetical protein